MLSQHPISGAPISGTPTSGNSAGNTVIVAPAFVSTGVFQAYIGIILSQPLVSAGSLSAIPLTGVMVPAFETFSTMSGAFSGFEISGETYQYYFTLTGAPDGTSDALIPISSFQCRLRSGDPTYLSVTIPYTDDYAEAINNRPNGEMKIDMALLIAGVEYVRSEIVRTNLENVRIDEGPQSSSITLTGHKTVTRAALTVTLQKPVYRAVTDGAIRLRFAEPHMVLKPGDTVICGNDTFTADEISIFIGASEGGNITRNMEISEKQ